MWCTHLPLKIRTVFSENLSAFNHSPTSSTDFSVKSMLLLSLQNLSTSWLFCFVLLQIYNLQWSGELASWSSSIKCNSCHYASKFLCRAAALLYYGWCGAAWDARARTHTYTDRTARLDWERVEGGIVYIIDNHGCFAWTSSNYCVRTRNVACTLAATLRPRSWVAMVFVALQKGIQLKYTYASCTLCYEIVIRSVRMQLHLSRFTAHTHTSCGLASVQKYTLLERWWWPF